MVFCTEAAKDNLKQREETSKKGAILPKSRVPQFQALLSCRRIQLGPALSMLLCFHTGGIGSCCIRPKQLRLSSTGADNKTKIGWSRKIPHLYTQRFRERAAGRAAVGTEADTAVWSVKPEHFVCCDTKPNPTPAASRATHQQLRGFAVFHIWPNTGLGILSVMNSRLNRTGYHVPGPSYR